MPYEIHARTPERACGQVYRDSARSPGTKSLGCSKKGLRESSPYAPFFSSSIHQGSSPKLPGTISRPWRLAAKSVIADKRSSQLRSASPLAPDDERRGPSEPTSVGRGGRQRQPSGWPPSIALSVGRRHGPPHELSPPSGAIPPTPICPRLFPRDQKAQRTALLPGRRRREVHPCPLGASYLGSLPRYPFCGYGGQPRRNRGSAPTM